MNTRFALDHVRSKPRREEASLQESLFAELQVTLPFDAFVFAVPNGGSRHPAEAKNLQKQGVVAGVPDLILIYRGKAFGLELKSEKGRTSDSQLKTFPKLRTAGMRIEVARTRNEAVEHIKEMGIPLRLATDTWGARDDFRSVTKSRLA